MTPLDARHLMESTEHLAVEINHFVNMVKAPLTDVDQGQLNKIEAESKSLVAFVNGITAPLVAFVNGITAPETVQAHDARVDQERRTGHNLPPGGQPGRARTEGATGTGEIQSTVRPGSAQEIIRVMP